MPFFNKRYHPAGTAPGTLTKPWTAEARPLRIRLFDYTADTFEILDDTTADACTPYLQRDTITWVHVEGQATEDTLRALGKSFGLHALALEDIVNAGQRPKIEPFTNQLFVVMSLPEVHDGNVTVHQVSMFLGDDYFISFCEADFALFQPIVNRLQVADSRMRSRGADYLMYSMLDIIIDHAFPLLEDFGARLEDLEEHILADVDESTLPHIHRIRRELILLRRSLWPQREVVGVMLRDPSALIHEDIHVYLRDCHDHTFQVMDLLETYRDMSSSILEIYLSSVSNRMNDVMRVLTVIATVFIPLTFIVGVYGMNFDPGAGPLSMPELRQPLGYVAVWLVMAAITVGMILFFRSRKWF